jgi:thiol-disulfide isomerase/thioredoxin
MMLCGILVRDVLPADALHLRARTLKGKTVRLSELIQGGPILLQFWRSCCHPCHRALGHLEEISREFAEQGLVVVTISVDETRNLSKAASLVKARGYTFMTLFDPNEEAFRKIKGRAVPHTLLLTAEARVIYAHVGYRDGDELEWRRAVEEAMAQWSVQRADSTVAQPADSTAAEVPR